MCNTLEEGCVVFVLVTNRQNHHKKNTDSIMLKCRCRTHFGCLPAHCWFFCYYYNTTTTAHSVLCMDFGCIVVHLAVQLKLMMMTMMVIIVSYDVGWGVMLLTTFFFSVHEWTKVEFFGKKMVFISCLHHQHQHYFCHYRTSPPPQ